MDSSEPRPSPAVDARQSAAADAVSRPAPAQPLALHSHAEFAIAVDRALADCRRRRTRLAVLVLNVVAVGLSDEAGTILRQASPKTEHLVLDKLSQRMQRLVRASDQVVRLDIHQIGVVLTDSSGDEACLVDGRAQRALAGPYSVDEQRLDIRLRIGRATYPEQGVTGRELVRAAHQVPLSLV